MSKILVAYDGSASARRALERAAELGRDGSEVDVIRVVPPALPVAGAAGAATTVEYLAQHRDELDAARSYLAAQDVGGRAIQVVGNPGRAICATAEREGHDLIVVGSRNLNGVQRLLLGSVSDCVAHRAPCDVLIAR